MSSQRPEEFPEPSGSRDQQLSDDRRGSDNRGPPNEDTRGQATVVVHGETVRNGKLRSPKDPPPPQEKSPHKKLSEAKVKMQARLPALDDDADVGVQKEQIVIRDGKADLAFTGVLLASAAPPSASTGQWREYRIYKTAGGKHVFSKVGRSVFAEEKDAHQAEVFDPTPSSVPSQVLRSARELARSRPVTWMDAAVAFFGYDPLAKALYRKFSGQFEEHIA